MGSLDKPQGTHSGDRSNSTRLLRVISETLGKPESQFLDRVTEPNDLTDLFELVDIYKSIKHLSDRRYLLAVARSLKSDE